MGKYQKLIIHRKLKVSTSVIFSYLEIQYVPAKASKFVQKNYQINDLGTVHEPPRYLIRGGLVHGIAAGDPIIVGVWIARSVAEWSVQTVSHACDPRMHCEPGILNRAYAKTVKLNPVKPTQERCVEKPRAARADYLVSLSR
jgi:hypothetical protein